MKIPLALLACILSASSAFAGDFSFQGTFLTDDQVQLFSFSIASDSTVSFQTYGYGGGTNAAGTVIQRGGFDSYLTWFQSDGTQVGSNDDGGCPPASSTRNDGCYDAAFHGTLSAGSYFLALTVSPNGPAGTLSEGFIQDGTGNFTANGACPAFCDVFGGVSNGNYAVDVLTVDSASVLSDVPEPASFGLMALAACSLALSAKARGGKQ
jgi:hypothetical protein